ncbi:MAG: transglutaminase domain-containing protein [Dehalococcoidia bacterium]|nr:transglutaminase domain-containing protein [Dehalococcoidia bacterium]
MAGMNPPLSRTQGAATEHEPHPGRQRPRILMSWEDWLTFAAALLVFLSLAVSIQNADLVRGMPALVPTAMMGLLTGLFVARIRAPQSVLHPAAIIVGIGVVILAAQAYADGATLQDRLVDARVRLEEWFHIVRAGDISNDNLPFVSLVHGITFLVGYLGTWAVYRFHNAWIAVLPAGVLLLANISILDGQPSTAFVFFLFGALLLLARMHLQRRQRAWRGERVEYPEFMSLNAAQLTVVIAAGLMIAAWLVPLGTQAQAAQNTLEWVTGPVADRSERLARVFHNLNIGSEGNFHSFADTLPIQGEVELGTSELYEVEGIDPGQGLVLLRGTSYDEYTGVGWKATDRDSTRVDGGSDGIGEEQYQDRELQTLEITVQDEDSVVLFPGIPFGTNLDTLVQSPEGTPGDIELVRSRRGLDGGDTYNAVGSVSVAPAEELRQAGAGYPDWVTERYTQIPDSLPDRVREEAQQIAGSEETPYDQAAAIEQYLRGFTFDYTVPAAPPNRDTVDFHLFDLQSGYFDYQASSMAVMLRSLGIPARVAVGYAVDTGSEEFSIGPQEVTKEDAYAWVEVFFPDYGWVNFNPTPDRPAGGNTGVGSGEGIPLEDQFFDPMFEEPALGGETIPPNVEDALDAEPTVQGGGFPWWIAWMGLGAVVVLAIAGGAGFATWNWGLSGLEPRAKLWAKTQRLGRWAGLSTHEDETPREWSRRAGQAVGYESEALNLAQAYEESRYGRPDLQRIDDDEVQGAYTRLRKALLRRVFRRNEREGGE